MTQLDEIKTLIGQAQRRGAKILLKVEREESTGHMLMSEMRVLAGIPKCGPYGMGPVSSTEVLLSFLATGEARWF